MIADTVEHYAFIPHLKIFPCNFCGNPSEKKHCQIILIYSDRKRTWAFAWLCPQHFDDMMAGVSYIRCPTCGYKQVWGEHIWRNHPEYFKSIPDYKLMIGSHLIMVDYCPNC